jgi:succinate dehydrogenase (ubiquinone) membrane anchor subunit
VTGTTVYHYVNLGLLVGVPSAFVAAPAALTTPLEAALAVFLPVHGHIAMNYVITDYVPKSQRGPARFAMLAATVGAIAGLLKLTLDGPGIVATYKALWKKSEKPVEEKSVVLVTK